MRFVGAIVLLHVSIGCGSFECDEQQVLLDTASAGSSDCGFANLNTVSSAPAPTQTRQCMVDALAQGTSFYGSVSPASADGGTVVGYVQSDTSFYKIRYSFVSAAFSGPCENFTAYRCTDIAESTDCNIQDDLCLTCAGSQELVDVDCTGGPLP